MQLIVAQEIWNSTGVRVLLGANGTQLHSHPIIGSEYFSKIIFNFPHVGGKMKIHLNRILMRDFFKSASNLLEPGGHVMVSLCKGQGGTPADVLFRRWSDTWQVVEMAAQAELILTDIEPFQSHLFPDYSSVGYRSSDISFHTDGALIHIFSHVATSESESLLQFQEPHIIKTNFGAIKCPFLYVKKYYCNPLDITGSPINYLYEKLKSFLQDELQTVNKLKLSKVKIIPNVEVPLHIEVSDGPYVCDLNGQHVHCDLRCSLLDVIVHILPFWTSNIDEVVMYSGLVFNKLGRDFSLPPLSNHVLILGNDVNVVTEKYIQHMLNMVTGCSYELSIEKCVEPCENPKVYDNIEISCMSSIVLCTKSSNKEHEKSVVIGKELSLLINESNTSLRVSCSIIYLDKLARVIFQLCNWRELWAKNVRVLFRNECPVLKRASLYPRSFTFDLSFSSDSFLNSKLFYNILWQIAGDIITDVEFLRLYRSPFGWCSSCYRISYQSFEFALHREKVIRIHEDILGKLVCERMGSSIH